MLEPNSPVVVLPGTDLDSPIFLMRSFQVLIGPSRYWHESPICDKLKHQKRCLRVLFVLRVCIQKQIEIVVFLYWLLKRFKKDLNWTCQSWNEAILTFPFVFFRAGHLVAQEDNEEAKNKGKLFANTQSVFSTDRFQFALKSFKNFKKLTLLRWPRTIRIIMKCPRWWFNHWTAHSRCFYAQQGRSGGRTGGHLQGAAVCPVRAMGIVHCANCGWFCV